MLVGGIYMEQLMEAVGCEKYPKRWKAIFKRAMEQYDREGCKFIEPQFYDELEETYHCFGEYKYAYDKAAKEAQKDEMLCRFLVLLSVALKDEEHRNEDLKEFKRPRTPEGKSSEAYEMATALAMCSQFHDTAIKLREKGIPEDNICLVLQYAAKGVRNYIWRHDGAIGFDLLEWAQKYMSGTLFPIGRLEIECYGTWEACELVLESQGNYVALQKVWETESHWSGYAYDKDGLPDKEQRIFSKHTWKKVLEKGEPVIQVHIPADGPMTEELVDRTIEETKAFIAQYLPDCFYKAFACHSWMMSTKLDHMLGPASNIVKFAQRFQRLICDGKGEDVFSFVFLKPDMNFKLEDLLENTTLEKKLKAHYLEGNVLQEMHGLFF